MNYQQQLQQSQVKQIFKEEALPLIFFEPQSRKYVVNEEAIDFLSKVPGPLAVVSVAGMYRTGKSYLLNRMLLNRQSGFGIGPSINPCTKGLWVWGKPLIGQTQEGDTVNIVVIDSEGIGALEEDSQHDNIVFALTILLSSCFIYNSIGNIDETAIQNLSLIVNLTKNIHIKSHNNNEEVDSEDYALYMPQFIWVVRDFSLQLVDAEGQDITSKEYLEKALAIQKGYSDSVESKNRIRRLLTTFFKERDCTCLVRPLTSEENLQNLDNIDFEQLRPEFFEQVINLRKRILNRIKVKTVNNKSLNGEMFVGLLQNYVRSINEGACPNIETAWSYICKNECIKAQYEAFESYDKFTKEVLSHKIPTLYEELKIYHKIAKENAKQIYQKKSMGDVSNDYFKQLIEKIKQRFNQIKNENEKESQRACISFINQEFLTIEKKIKNYEYKLYSDFERDTKLFYSYFMDNGPKTVNKQLILLEFLQKSIFDGSHYFIRRIIEESELQKMLKSELQNKLEQQIQDAREDGQREKNSLLIKIAQLETEKAEIEVREQCLKESLNEVQNEKERNERNLKQQYENEKSEMERIISELQQKLMCQEERVKELERQEILQESEKEKEKALLVQKLQFLEKNLGEFHKKEKNQTDELKTTKKQYGTQLKEASVKYEQQTKQLQNTLNELQEKYLELENELATKEQKFEMEKKKWKMSETNFQQKISEQTEKIQQLSDEIKEHKQSEEKNADVLNKEQVKNYEQQSSKVREQEIQLKEREETLKNIRANAEKDKAVYQQKLEFLELQLRETKQQLVENKKNHESILKALENSNNNDVKPDNSQVTEMTECHKKEIKNLESEFEQTKKRMLQQISSLNEKNNELELKFKLEMSDKMKEIENLQDLLDQSERARVKLQDQNKSLDTSKLKLLKESEERNKQKIDQLEEQIEELKTKFSRETKEIQSKSEEQLAQLKNFYELERERLEKKLVEEKLKVDKKFAQLNDEFDQKLRDEQQNYEEEVEQLKEDLREQELQSQSIIQQCEHELALKTQTIESLDKYVKETKESLTNIQNTHNVNLEQQLSSFNLERKALMNKIDSIQIELTKKDKELMVIAQRKDQIEQLLQKKEQSMEMFKMELSTEKSEYNTKLEDARQKLSALNDEFLAKKIEFGREIALSNQQNEFLTKKLEDLQKQQTDQQTLYEEKLKTQKQDFQQEILEKVERAQEEQQKIQEKYNNTKKNLKQIEATYNQQLSQLEKDKAICLEKLTHIENKKSEIESRLQNEIVQLQAQLSKFKENVNNDKNSQTIQLDKYKQKLFDIENEKNELLSNYERDKALWEGKFQFLEQQKDQLKQELGETKKNFEMTVNYLNKIKNEKERNDKDVNVNQVVKQLEDKYAAQIKEIEENYAQQITKLQEKITKLQKENKQISDKITLENHGKTENQLFTQKKIAEFQENEKKLQQEIENLKEERDQKIIEYQKQIDQERENLRQKINGLETKLKESEGKRTQLFFEHEKELAKWNMEKDNLQTKSNELQDQVERLERKREGLLRENERLKNDSRTSRKSMNLYCNTQVGNQLLGTGKSFLNSKNQHQSPLHKSTLSNNNYDKNLQDITNLNSKLPPKVSYGGGNSGNNSLMYIDKDNVSFQIKSTQDLLMGNSEKEMTFGNGAGISMNNFESQNLLTSSSNDENLQN